MKNTFPLKNRENKPKISNKHYLNAITILTSFRDELIFTSVQISEYGKLKIYTYYAYLDSLEDEFQNKNIKVRRDINFQFEQWEVSAHTCSFTDFRKLSKRLEFSPLALDIVCIRTKSLDSKPFMKLKKDESGRRPIRL